MNDIQTHLDKIRSDAAECVLLSNLVADGKGEVFARTAKHLSALALEIEKTIATNSADKGTRGESVNMARAGDREEAVATDIAAAPHQQAVRPRAVSRGFSFHDEILFVSKKLRSFDQSQLLLAPNQSRLSADF